MVCLPEVARRRGGPGNLRRIGLRPQYLRGACGIYSDGNSNYHVFVRSAAGVMTIFVACHR